MDGWMDHIRSEHHAGQVVGTIMIHENLQDKKDSREDGKLVTSTNGTWMHTDGGQSVSQEVPELLNSMQ